MSTSRPMAMVATGLALAILVLAAGCGSTDEAGPVEAAPVADGATGGDLPAGEAPAPAGTNPAAPTPAAPAVVPRAFTLAAVQARILERANLRLAAYALREAEAQGRVDQAALWPNPYLLVRKRRIDDLDISGTGFLEVEVGQPFELGGKRGARTRQAEAEADVVTEEVRALTVLTLRDAAHQFYRVLRLAEDRGQAEEEARAAADLARLAKARFESGKASRTAWLRFEATASDTRLAVQDLTRRHEAACRALDELLGTPAGTVQGVEGSFEPTVLTGVDRRAAKEALARHPRLRVRERAVVAAARSLDSATANAWPDLTAALAVERDDDEHADFFGFLFKMPLPLWNRNQGERAAARAAGTRAQRDLQAETLTLQVALGEAWIAYDRAERNVAGYTRDVIPPLQTSLDLTRQAFEAGKVAYLDVLDALVALIRARRARLDHLEARARAAVEIRYLTSAGLEK